MLKIMLFVSLLLFVMIQQMSAQGIIIEPTALFTKQHNEMWLTTNTNGNYITSYTEENKNYVFSGVGVYYSFLFELSRDVNLELRPGVFISNKVYSAFPVGVYLRYYFSEAYFVSSGIITELHSAGGHSFRPVQWPFSGSLSLGREILEKLYIILSYSKTFNEDYGSESTAFTNPTKSIRYSLKSSLKIGVQLTF